MLNFFSQEKLGLAAFSWDVNVFPRTAMMFGLVFLDGTIPL